MEVSDLLEFIFGGEPENICIFDGASERKISKYSEADTDDILLNMLDARIDLCAGGLAYAVSTDDLPDADAALRATNADEGISVYLLKTPTEENLIPEHWKLDIPLPGVGWVYEEGNVEMFDLADLIAKVENNAQDSEIVSDVPVEASDAGGGDREADTVAENSEPEMMNDAEILGKDHPDLEAFLQKPIVFMTGDMYGQKDRRNTFPGKWKRTELPMIDWLEGGDGWGLSRHLVSREKGGSSIVPSDNVGGERTDAATKTMHAIGIDIDDGTPLDDVVDKLEELNTFAFVYTTFSHRKTKMEFKHDAVVKAMGLSTTPTRTQIQEYLRLHVGKYDRKFINEIEVVNARDHQADGMKIVLKTPPIDKFRVIFPLAEPVELADLAATMNGWKEVWADKVCGVAVNMLDAVFDSTSCDINRLFFTPRHPQDADEWYSAVILGAPLKFEDIEPYSKAKYVRERSPKGDPYMAAAGGDKGDAPPRCDAPSGMNLNDWHKITKDRFLLADVLESFCSDKIRIAGGEKLGTVHTECPFEHDHSSTGGTATMAMNATDSDSGYWTMFCKHDSCAGRHKLEFLQEMLAQNWFDEDVLKDNSFVLPPADAGADQQEEEPETAPTIPAAVEAEAFNFVTPTADIEKFIKRHFKLGADIATRGAIDLVLASNTHHSRAQLRRMWQELENEQTARRLEEAQADIENFDGFPVVNIWHFKDQVTWATKRIQTFNSETPTLFHYMESVARLCQNSAGDWNINRLTRNQFAAELNNLTRWNHQTASGNNVILRGVSAPDDVVDHVYNDFNTVYPALRGIVTSPTFTKTGSLITEIGFDHESGLYYQPDIMLDVPKVSDSPSAAEVKESLRLLIDEVLSDFPLGGYTRDEIIEMCCNGGSGVPAVTHCLCMMLLFFVRDMIDGPTPGHLMGKPAPGTGASLLTDTISLLATGSLTPAASMPSNPEEMGKTITAFLVRGAPMIFFDNINHSVDSDALALALTSSTYGARILGKTETVQTEVRCVWTFTGNNVQLSNELLRRCVLIDLDAHSVEPEKRSGWRHTDIRNWVRAHRGELVWACLTLVQNWIATGKKKYDGDVLNSYENWSYVMGGIMEAAGVEGFLGNRSELKLMSDDNSDLDILLFLEEWWSQHGVDWVHVRPQEKSDSLINTAIAGDIEVGCRKQKDNKGEVTYSVQHFEKFLARYQARVFRLYEGKEVRMVKSHIVTKRGTEWRLEVMNHDA